ncbi:MAG: hypothetical protein ABIF19_15950 [Planctomycetota bacterium]
MKRYVLGIVLVSMLVPVAAFCRDFGREDAEHEMALRDRDMEFQQHQAEMDMEREMQKLELEERRFKLERAREGHKEKVHPLLLLVVVIHILVAVWVHMDIRQLNRGSGIWVVIALLAGLFGALVYAVVRLGDGRPAKS